jgi:hypothetical protein
VTTASTELLPVGAEASSVSVADVGGAVEAEDAATLASPVVATEVVVEAAVSASELVDVEEDADAVVVEVEVDEAAVSASELVEVEEDADVVVVEVEVDAETVDVVLVVLAVAETVVSTLAVGVVLVDDALTLVVIVEGAADGGEPSAIAVAAYARAQTETAKAMIPKRSAAIMHELFHVCNFLIMDRAGR